MILALKQIDEDLVRPLGRSQWYFFYKTWLLVIKAEFTIRLNDFDRYEYLMKQIQLHFAQIPTQLLKNRLAKIISVSRKSSKKFSFYGSYNRSITTELSMESCEVQRSTHQYLIHYSIGYRIDLPKPRILLQRRFLHLSAAHPASRSRSVHG